MNSEPDNAQADFWNAVYDSEGLADLRDPFGGTPTGKYFQAEIGDVTGLRILEIGCGVGDLALTLAENGATVVGLDTSSRAIETAEQRARTRGLGERTQFLCGDVASLGDSMRGSFDLLIGRFVLHHLEPFEENVEILARTLSPGGRAVFWENSSRNPLLMFARRYVIGRFGIPKFGDNAEHPLTGNELRILEAKFCVRIIHPELIFFQLVSTYLLRSEKLPRWIKKVPFLIDKAIERLFPTFKRFSYYQVLAMKSVQNDRTENGTKTECGLG
jgi:ubiquinone/menaquinone biosynthesis C-methylase UbiE